MHTFLQTNLVLAVDRYDCVDALRLSTFSLAVDLSLIKTAFKLQTFLPNPVLKIFFFLN